MIIWRAAWEESENVVKKKISQSGIPKFTDEQHEAEWWASAKGREFVKEQSARRGKRPLGGGSKLVANLARANSVQIALRLPAPDLGKAREIAERKGIGYQTLLKMIIHEGLQREGRRDG